MISLQEESNDGYAFWILVHGASDSQLVPAHKLASPHCLVEFQLSMQQPEWYFYGVRWNNGRLWLQRIFHAPSVPRSRCRREAVTEKSWRKLNHERFCSSTWATGRKASSFVLFSSPLVMMPLSSPQPGLFATPIATRKEILCRRKIVFFVYL